MVPIARRRWQADPRRAHAERWARTAVIRPRPPPNRPTPLPSPTPPPACRAPLAHRPGGARRATPAATRVRDQPFDLRGCGGGGSDAEIPSRLHPPFVTA
ncbi:hypothetical protein GCM10009759_44510 [Kitasatospora saccharophila]|uniref:Uncharacterized protein n=1 Tax=Kitasatospora saccharophila TaxID=407973 RepID=A0ABN2X8I3_9ACTN